MNLTEQKLPAGWLSQHHKVLCSLLQEKRHEGPPQMLDPTGLSTRWSNSGIAVTGVSNCSELPQTGSRACYYKSGRKPTVWENLLLLFCWMLTLLNGFLRISQMPRINDCWMLSPKWNIYVTPSLQAQGKSQTRRQENCGLQSEEEGCEMPLSCSTTWLLYSRNPKQLWLTFTINAKSTLQPGSGGTHKAPTLVKELYQHLLAARKRRSVFFLL